MFLGLYHSLKIDSVSSKFSMHLDHSMTPCVLQGTNTTHPPKCLLACGSERISLICFREDSSSLISWSTLIYHLTLAII
jgi:hypothetical protein